MLLQYTARSLRAVAQSKVTTEKKTLYSCALLEATEVSTSGFDHHRDGGAESDGASRATEADSRGNHYPVW